ncbi:MAG: ATP-binding protein [Candidatus Acidiferrales bacterium]
MFDILRDSMKLVSFSVDKFRSITRARKLAIQDLTILIGPNNEGKSNILRAFVIVLDLVSRLSGASLRRGRIRSIAQMMRDPYEWERDFPVSLQPRYPDGESVFNLAFELTDLEVGEFWDEVRSNIDGHLPVQITVGRKEPGFKITKRGPGAEALSRKAQSIADFIGKRFEFRYIPAVRTANIAENVVEEMIDRELKTVEDDPSYRAAQNELAKQYAPVLERLSASITGTLKGFLPKIQNVSVKMSDDARYRALRRSFEIIVDDGTPTNLRQKGDGVQSLVALGLMRHSSESDASGRSLVLAVEEPESHLHPRAIHQLKTVLQQISTKHQVIITTHCPLFVNRADIRSNILVTGNQAVAAKTSEQIRAILGVRASDNLRNAELILFVEGEDDRIAFMALLPALSEALREGLVSGVFAVDSLLGGTNLSYKLSQARDALCISHCFLDNDDCGRDAFKRAALEGLITEAEATFAICEGMPDSEIEDLYSSDVYDAKLLNSYGVTVDCPKFKTGKKWSQRMQETFKQHGKQWDATCESRIKKDIAELVAASGQSALNEHKRSSVDALVAALERKLKAVSPAAV